MTCPPSATSTATAATTWPSTATPERRLRPLRRPSLGAARPGPSPSAAPTTSRRGRLRRRRPGGFRRLWLQPRRWLQPLRHPAVERPVGLPRPLRRPRRRADARRLRRRRHGRLAVYGYSPDDGFSRFGVLYSRGRPTLTPPFGGPATRLVADYDGDGVTDLAVYGYSPDDNAARFAVLPSGGGPAYPQPLGDDTAIPSPSSGYLTLHGLPTMSASSARQLAALAAFDLDAVARDTADRPRP